MAINSIITRDQLKNTIFEQLGLQFHRVMLTEEQLDIIIDQTLQKFFEDGDFGTEERYAELQLIQGQQDYKLDYEVASVDNIIETNNILDFFSIERTVIDATIMQRPNQLRLLDVELSRQYMSQVRKQLLKSITFDFNPVTKKLHLFIPPKETSKVVLHLHRTITEADENTDFGNVYGHPWIKEYVLALCMIQIGTTLSIYGDSTLPNNVKVNYQTLLDRGDKMKDKLEEDLIKKYSAPVPLIMG